MKITVVLGWPHHPADETALSLTLPPSVQAKCVDTLVRTAVRAFSRNVAPDAPTLSPAQLVRPRELCAAKQLLHADARIGDVLVEGAVSWGVWLNRRALV